MASWLDTITSLFSQKIIVKRMPGGRLKTIDFNKIQSLGAESMAGYSRVRRSYANIKGYANTPNIEAIEALRQQLYTDYNLMDTDPILSSALDIYADECTAKSAHGLILTIKTTDPKIKKVLYNLFYDVLNIEFNLWSWIRTTCKFGDCLLYLKIEPTVGVIDVVPIHPAFLRRNDSAGDNEDETEFTYEGPSNIAVPNSKFRAHEVAHFRLLNDIDFIPYGKSMLEGARKVYKQLILMEDAMLLHRIMRAPERRLIKVDVGNLPPESIDAYIEKVADGMKKVPLFDEYGNYNLRYNLMSMLEDYYLPQRNGETGTSIEPLEGLKNEGAIDDIEYLRDKMMAFLKIPKAFLGYQTMGDQKTSLASEDIRFARTIERIQKIIASELKKIAVIHLYVQGFTSEDALEFDIELSPPSMIYERQKIDMLNEKVNLVQNIRENKLFSRKHIYEEIFGMAEEEWKEQLDLIAEDLKEEFRYKQIEEEGNDPKISGKSFGTAHDIASMHVASNLQGTGGDSMKQLYTPDARHDNEGRPEKQGSYGRHKDPGYGLDPFGEKEMSRNMRSTESVIKSLKNYTQMKSVKTLYENTDKFDQFDMLNEEKYESENG